MSSDMHAQTGTAPRFRLPPAVTWGLLAVIQLALIAVPLVDRLQVQMTGREATLALVPIDPRDLLRGDYVIINLAIARLPASLPGAADLRVGDRVSVQLEPGLTGVADAVAIDKYTSAAGAMTIAGQVTSATGEEIRIDYGIDAFFLPEGEGLVIEKLDTDRVRLVVAVARDGRSLPLRLLVDGKPFKSDAIF